MKKLILASVLTLGIIVAFVYADNKAATELEHASKLATGDDSVAEDMAAMKAAGKCSADQSSKIKVKKKVIPRKPTKAELELEHANRLRTGDDSVAEDMGNMKALGKCNTGQNGKCGSDRKGKCGTDKSAKKKVIPRKPTKAELELEHAIKLRTGDDSVAGDMGNMKALGKCNTD